jgi:ubiquinone/menaquinone biosynthesis C-methylase UbiE
MSQERADYGIDAPRVVRNQFVVGGLGLSAWGIAFAASRFGGAHIPQGMLGFVGMAFGTGMLCTLLGVWMVWESKVGKIRRRERLLHSIDWTGAERVLDVGCGRGLLLIGAAKRLSTGKATGIDIWQAEDLSGNRPEDTLENARKEGVADRVDVQTADVRQIPYADASFDVVVSRAVIHNLYKEEDRDQAIREISRVLKPGGRAVIDDIRHHGQYTRIFLQNGCSDVRLARSLAVYVFFMLITFGSLRPATLVVRKLVAKG